MATTPNRYGYFGAHFPLLRRYWGGHFPEATGPLIAKSIPVQGIAPPSTTAGAGLLELVLENGCAVTYSWSTTIRPDLSGKERRAALLDRPNETYKGTALLAGGDVRTLRSLLQSAGASGAPYQLGLPYLALTITGDAVSTVIPVTDTSAIDWAIQGQRVLIVDPDGDERIAAVLQVAGPNEITVDIEPGAVARYGSSIMPTVPVYLEAQQNFARYTPEEPIEQFQLAATAVRAGFIASGIAAVLPLVSVSTSGVLADLVVVAKVAGLDGNGITVQQEATALPFGVNIEILEDAIARTVLVKFRAGVATVQQYVDAFTGASLVTLAGDYVPTDTLSAATDEWVPVPLAGGLGDGFGAVGRGASVTTYDGRPVYDRGLIVQTTATDMIHALTELIDLGGLPSNLGNATTADWGRAATIESDSDEERQWFTLFLATVRGRQRGWWLPTWRNDLIPISTSAGSAAVTATLPLAPPVANSGAMDGLTIEALVAGASGNAITVTFTADAIDTGGEFDDGGGAITVRFVSGVTTDAQIKTLVNGASALVRITGTTSGMALQVGDDELGPTPLYGGLDAIGSTLTVSDEIGDGSFHTWYPQRDRIQVLQDDGTITYAKIVSTFTTLGSVGLNLDSSLSGSPIVSVSWLELCRFESDSITVTWKGTTFTSSNQARTIQLVEDDPGSGFDADASSVEDSQPREGIQIDMPYVTHRISTSTSDITIGGFPYRAATAKRDDIAIAGGDTNDVSLKITLPKTHLAVRRYNQQCTPPKQVLVTLWTQQKRSGEARVTWQGYWKSTSLQGHLAVLEVVALTTSLFAKRLPTITASRSCANKLFDRNCRLDAAAYAIPATVTFVGGAVIHVSTVGSHPDQWMKFGHVLHPSGEWMQVVDQVGTTITMLMPLYEMKDGDSVTLYPGCDHNVQTGCRDKFNNVRNFVGAPIMIGLKPFKANTPGVWL